MVVITTIDVLDVKFDNVTLEEAISLIFKKYKSNGKVFVVTANPEIVMYAKRDDNYREIIEQSDIVVADGIGVVLASKLLGKPLKERVAGYDLTLELLRIADEKKLKVFLLGAKDEVIEKTVYKVKSNYPNIDVVGSHNGYFDIDDMSIIDTVGKATPDIVLVATGYPRQEKWIKKYHVKYGHSIAMGVGGSFDVIAGVSKRAPELIINYNLEWAYRLIKEPNRFFRMLDLPRFMIKAVIEFFLNKGS